MVTREAYRLATESDGKTRISTFEIELHDVEVGTGLQVATLQGGGVGVLRFPPGFERDWHNSEAVTWIFVLSGSCEIAAYDEGVVTLVPGDIMFFDDLVGGGHRTKVPPDADMWMATGGLAVD